MQPLVDFTSSAVFWFIAVPVGLLLLPYVAGPVLIRFTQKMSRSPTVLTYDADEQPAPEWVQDYLDYAEATLWGCGFEALHHIVLPDLMPNVQAIFVLMTRPESNDAAIAAAMFGTGANASIRKHHVEFATDYADGFELCTNNTSEESVFKALPHKRVLQFDFVSDPAVLWEIHERALQEFAIGSKKSVPDKSQAIEAFREALVKEFTDQVEVGWLWCDESHDVFRPTWKGACLMVWKLCWPVSTLRRAARRKNARRLLREWDMTA